MNNDVGLDIRKEIRMCITDDTLDIVFPFKMTSVILGKWGDYSGNALRSGVFQFYWSRLKAEAFWLTSDIGQHNSYLL